MNKERWILLAVVLGLFGGTASLLAYWKVNQRLGLPGVRVVTGPVSDPEGKTVVTNTVYLPERVLDYSSEELPVTSVELGVLPEDTTYGRRHYRAADGFEILVSVVLMGTDRTSIHKPQYCLTGQGWRIDRSERTTISVEHPDPYDLPVMKLTATTTRETAKGEKTVAKGVYVYWFVADKALTADHFQRMWWMARDLICARTLQRWAYVSCFAVCLPGQEEAMYQRMKEFIAASVPEFQLTTGVDSAKIRSGAPPPLR